MTEAISARFDYPKRHVTVHGARMAYVDEGQGDPIVFLHGNPTSSYLWRNIIPHVRSLGRCIALDLIGMGDSEQPDLAYSFADHARYLDGFLRALELSRITFVAHDWGSALAFDWAARHESAVRALAFTEAILAPVDSWDLFPAVARERFQRMRTPGLGEQLVLERNLFVEELLPASVLRGLTPDELAQYRAPYPDARSRRPLLAWPRQLPIAGEPPEILEIVACNRAFLCRSQLPKLLLTCTPGALVPPPVAAWCRDNLPQLELVDVGPAIHYPQEDRPHEIGRALAAFISKLG
jgi:haloalkane dehalogenase